ncbi:MAG: alpha-amylase/4-alpha-glucanotransferase domain-containing protein [Thermodesulfobacteriota bacterium]
MSKVAFLFCVHNHQPVGNFPHVLENAFEKAYHPFIEILKKYPFMKVTIHYSGVLWDFFRENHPEFLDTLRALVQKGQLEMMTGGCYEPILPVIPDEDKVGQIKRLTKTIEEEMGVIPQGMWLAERVWEPHLPKFLVEAGVEYITVDDYHFKKAGLREENLYGYYTTEEEGKILKAFPGSETLRYIIPFHPVEETLEYLSRLKGSSQAAIFSDDGEKFGIWPYTFHSVYEEGWLERFFQLLGEHLDWIEPMFLGDYATRAKPLGRIYLPCSSYMEMDEWSLPTEAMVEYGRVVEILKELPEGESIRRFIKGGFWRNFFAKYPESNDLHKRVLHLREKIGKRGKRSIPESRDPLLHLYRAQCNDAYWHGVFGGLYLPHLRHALYENLIRAEALYDQEARQGKERVDLERLDFNGDGDEEVLLKTPQMVLLFSSRGGGLLEMDDRLKAFNILDTLTRRREGYHQKLLEDREKTSEGEASGSKTRTIHEIFDSKEDDLDQYLHFDQYRRTSFLDHFIPEPMDFESFRKCQYEEEGDFIKELYEIKVRRKGGNREVLFSRLGRLYKDGREQPVKVEKRFVPFLDRSVVKATYRISYLGEEKKRTNFGVEFNINLLAGNAPDRYYHIPGHRPGDRRLSSTVECGDVSEIQLIDEWNGMKVVLKMDRKCSLWRFPILTVSLSESGFEKIFQGSCLLAYWPLELEPRGQFEVSIELGIYHL